MRVLTLCLGIAIMLTAACGGGSSNGATGGTGAGGVNPLGGNTALGGSSGSSSIPLTGACANLTCLNPLLALLSNPACQVSATDTCTEQTDLTTYAVSDCYSNGVKMQMDITTMTMTVKSGSSICYSMVIGGLGAAATVTMKNGSGTTVATIATDGKNDTVTCPGGTPTVIDSTCGSAATSASPTVPTTTGCTTGACTF